MKALYKITYEHPGFMPITRMVEETDTLNAIITARRAPLVCRECIFIKAERV